MLAGAGMISFSAVFVKLAAVSPTASAFYRVSFGFCFLLALAAIRHELARPSLRQLALLIGCGLAFALDLYFWHESIHSIGPGLATLIGNFQVFFLAAFAILFFGDKPSLGFLLALPIAMVGLFFVVGIDWHKLDDTYKTGVYFALLIARALPRLPTALGGLMLLLQPALSFVWDVLFFNRPTSVLNWIGVALALAAIYMGARSRVGA